MRVFFRSENSKRSKEIKLCIVYAHIYTHTQPSTFMLLRSHKFRVCEEFSSDFEVVHFSREGDFMSFVLLLQRANFQCESRNDEYIICIARVAYYNTWWKRKLLLLFRLAFFCITLFLCYINFLLIYRAFIRKCDGT